MNENWNDLYICWKFIQILNKERDLQNDWTLNRLYTTHYHYCYEEYDSDSTISLIADDLTHCALTRQLSPPLLWLYDVTLCAHIICPENCCPHSLSMRTTNHRPTIQLSNTKSFSCQWMPVCTSLTPSTNQTKAFTRSTSALHLRVLSWRVGLSCCSLIQYSQHQLYQTIG